MASNDEEHMRASLEGESTIKDIWRLTQEAPTGVDLQEVHEAFEYRRNLREDKFGAPGDESTVATETENMSSREQEASVSLQRSLHLLDVAVGTPSRLLRPKLSRFGAAQGTPMSMSSLIADTSAVSADQTSMFVHASSHQTAQDITAMSENIADEADDIYAGFLTSVATYRSEHQLFELLASYENICHERVTALKKIVHGLVPGEAQHVKTVGLLRTLSDEKATWSLILSLFTDRLRTDASAATTDAVSDMIKYQTEKEVVDGLYLQEASIRQAQLVVDWLEQIAAEVLDEYYDQVEFFTDHMGTWENTLHALSQQRAGVATAATRPIVQHMDPDAPLREGRPLADLDMEDERRLLRYLFSCVRAGQLDQAQRLCVRVGQPWRAATLEGWRLHHDPNYRGAAADDLLTPTGNELRDVWKAVCWRMADDEKLSVHERALYAVFSGHLACLLPVCVSWLDWLWAHTRTLIDVRVEQEIRINSALAKTWHALPQQYWTHSLSVEDIFHEIETSRNQAVQQEAKEPFHVIQKYIILNDIDGLVEEMYDWCRQEKVSSQLLRFIAHLILFLRATNVNTKEELCVSILEAYVKQLIDERRSPLVALYTSTLPRDLQVEWYAKFLEGVTDTAGRQACLQLAADVGLDVAAATKLLVEKTRNCDAMELSMDMRLALHDSATTEEDQKKIDCIDWLVFNPAQRAEALRQANALMRSFIGTKKLSAAREVFNKLPPGSVDLIFRDWKAETGSADLCAEDENAIREYLCVQAYLDANDSFNDWFEHNHNARPKEPPLASAANFSERVAFEHRLQRYETDMDRWRHTLTLQTKVTVDKIYNVLLFVDGGWLVDRRTDCVRDAGRTHQLRLLRQLCLPPLSLLLHTVLHTTRMYRECVQLADVIASEHTQLYRVFRRDELQSLLQRIHSSCVLQLEKGKDSLGYSLDT